MVLESLDRRISNIINKCSIPFDLIYKYVNFVFENNFFVFNDKFYRQIAGIPMGDCLSPLFADIVMDDLELYCWSKLKNNFNINPLWYYRYVDDSSMLVHKDHIDKILQIFNSYHPKLKFTHEIEVNKRLNFLDVTLINFKNKIFTDWYQKPTCTYRTLNFNSNHPISLKRNIIFNLVDRCINLSHPKYHLKNLKLVEKMLLINDYPIDFIIKNINVRLKKINHCPPKNTLSNSKPPLDFTRSIKVSIPVHEKFFNKCKHFLKKYNVTTVPKINKNLQDRKSVV